MGRTKTREERYRESLASYSKDREGARIRFLLAICWMQLGDYPQAQQFFCSALDDFVGTNRADRFWLHSAQPHWLVDAYIMSGETRRHTDVLRELEAYKLSRLGTGLWALYSYSVMDLLAEKDADVGQYVADLLAKPRIKDMFAEGKAIQDILHHDQATFDEALAELLSAHRGMAKFGGLRWTAEGFLCLAAMSLAMIALARGMTVNADSEYLSRGYLGYLVQRTGDSDSLPGL